jgi:hypothetical protein
MSMFKFLGVILVVGVSVLVGCDNTPPSGAASPSSTPGVEAAKPEAAGGGRRLGRPGTKKALSGQAPVPID